MTVDFIYNSLVAFFPDWANKDPFLMISMLLPLVATFGFITIYALVVIYAELKVSSFIQDKVGPMGQGVGLHAGKCGLLQPIADALKLLSKEDIIPSSANKVLFILAPFMIFIGAFISFVALPFNESIIVSDLNIGIFYILGVGSLAVIALNTALHLGQVVQIVPIVAASPIFTLILSVSIFRKERITKRIVLAVFMVVPAVALIASSS